MIKRKIEIKTVNIDSRVIFFDVSGKDSRAEGWAGGPNIRWNDKGKPHKTSRCNKGDLFI